MSQLAQNAQIPAEASVCAAALQGPDMIPDANLSHRHFASNALGCLWSILTDLYSEGSASTDLEQLTTLASRRAREMGRSDLNEMELIELSGTSFTAENIAFYGQVVRDEWMKREATKRCGHLFESGKVGTALLDEIIQSVTDINPDRRSKEPTLAELTDEVLRLSEGEDLSGVSSGFDDLDQITQGLPRGLVTILAARPSVGKSTMAIAMALNGAMRGVRTEFYTLEDSNAGITRRMLANLSGIGTSVINGRRLSAENRARLRAAKVKLDMLPLVIHVGIPESATQWALEAKRNCIRNKTEVIYIDYVQCFSEPGAGSRNDEVATVSRRIKSLADSSGAAVVLCSQFRRLRDGEKPGLADLRDSGALEQDAHIVLTLHDDDSSGATRSLLILKNKDGPTTSIRLRWDKKIPTFHSNGMDDFLDRPRQEQITQRERWNSWD